jgi:hypothetical protein
VPRAELACCRVRCDGELMDPRPGKAALRLLSSWTPTYAADWCSCMARGTGAPHVAAEEFTCRGHATWYGLRLGWRRRELMRTSCLSCKADTRCARQRLVVRGGDWSDELTLVGNLSDKLPTSREQDVLPVMVLIGVLRPPCLESWPSRCQWCQMTPSHG